MKQARYVHVVLKSLTAGDEECVEFCLKDRIEEFFIFTNEELGSKNSEIYSEDSDIAKAPMSMVGETNEDSSSTRIDY